MSKIKKEPRNRCQTCRHFDRTGKQSFGTCMRFPPVYIGSYPRGEDGPQPDFAFPLVERTWWCGEWSRDFKDHS